ncbi:MAG: stage III sporulation protein AB [Eubacteriales bacterium]
MLLKSFGVIVLLGMTLYLCISFSVFERRRMAQSEGFLLLVRHIKAQIACFRLPLGEIFHTFAHAELERCGFLPTLREGRDFAAALQAAAPAIWLSAEESGLLRAFAGELGRSYREEQVACCEYYAGELEQAYAQRRRDHPTRAKLYRSLFVTGALMLIIILV